MIRLLSGDCRDVLLTLPAESVQCVAAEREMAEMQREAKAQKAKGKR